MDIDSILGDELPDIMSSEELSDPLIEIVLADILGDEAEGETRH